MSRTRKERIFTAVHLGMSDVCDHCGIPNVPEVVASNIVGTNNDALLFHPYAVRAWDFLEKGGMMVEFRRVNNCEMHSWTDKGLYCCVILPRLNHPPFVIRLITAAEAAHRLSSLASASIVQFGSYKARLLSNQWRIAISFSWEVPASLSVQDKPKSRFGMSLCLVLRTSVLSMIGGPTHRSMKHNHECQIPRCESYHPSSS